MSGTSSALEHDSIPPYGTAGVHEVHGLPLPEQLRRMWPETDFPDASSELPVAPKDPPPVDSVGGLFISLSVGFSVPHTARFTR